MSLRRSLLRFVALGAMASAVLVASPHTAPPLDADGSQSCDVPTQRITLYAEELPREDGRIRLAYGLTPDSASIPGPTIEMFEGECVAITLVNNVRAATLAELRDDPLLGSRDPNMPLGVSLHVHGVKYTVESDGTHVSETQSSIVPPDGGVRTYVWYAAPRIATAQRVTSQGTAGYWWYHDHIAGTDHGTGGLYSGLLGGLVVRRAGDLKPDRPTNVVAFTPNQTINFKAYPDTPRFTAKEGERVEFLVIGIGDEFHTFHLHAHTWADNRTGILANQLDDTQLIDAKTIGPSETFGFQVIAGEDVGPGSWMLHCHVQLHSDFGMVTFFDVEPSGLPATSIGAPTPAPHVHFGRPRT
ncbi:MAG TPA: multicopper oxidase domain-containing protein [Actinomycetota bacterium]|nr:multicopper oxidase domain-containing protein [Actinomycetota bacterium]